MTFEQFREYLKRVIQEPTKHPDWARAGYDPKVRAERELVLLEYVMKDVESFRTFVELSRAVNGESTVLAESMVASCLSRLMTGAGTAYYPDWYEDHPNKQTIPQPMFVAESKGMN